MWIRFLKEQGEPQIYNDALVLICYHYDGNNLHKGVSLHEIVDIMHSFVKRCLFLNNYLSQFVAVQAKAVTMFSMTGESEDLFFGFVSTLFVLLCSRKGKIAGRDGMALL